MGKRSAKGVRIWVLVYSCDVTVQLSIATVGGVTNELAEKLGHWGLQSETSGVCSKQCETLEACGETTHLKRTWTVCWPVGMSIVRTVHPGFGWSCDAVSVGSAGSVARRTGSAVPNAAVAGLSSLTIIVSPPSSSVAVRLLSDMVIVAFVCMRLDSASSVFAQDRHKENECAPLDTLSGHIGLVLEQYLLPAVEHADRALDAPAKPVQKSASASRLLLLQTETGARTFRCTSQ